MAIAKVELNDLIKYKEEIEQLIEVLRETQGGIDELEKTDNDIKKEIGEYEDASRKCDQIISELNDKLRQLEDKERQLEQEIRMLKAEIQAVKAEIAALEAEVAALVAELAAAPPKAKAAVAAKLSKAKANLSKAKARKAELERKLDQAERELDRTKRNIETANRLINQSEQKQSQIGEGIRNLNSSSEDLRRAINELKELLQRMIGDSQHSTDCLGGSQEYINHYIEIKLENVEYTPPKDVKLRKCLNFEYAGRIYDYNVSRNDNEQLYTAEQVRYFQETYPDIKYSEIDGFGNTYPDFKRFEKFSYKFPPVSKENLANGTCLIGDSKSGSADFKKFRQAMESAGYSKQEIAQLLSTHTIHHDEDGQTMRLIPRDLHKACRHNGGAEKIRLQIAML